MRVQKKQYRTMRSPFSETGTERSALCRCDLNAVLNYHQACRGRGKADIHSHMLLTSNASSW